MKANPTPIHHANSGRGGRPIVAMLAAAVILLSTAPAVTGSAEAQETPLTAPPVDRSKMHQIAPLRDVPDPPTAATPTAETPAAGNEFNLQGGGRTRSGLLGRQGKRGLTGSQPIEVSARILANSDGKTGQLQVRAELAEGWHVYSLNQPEGDGAPQATKIVLKESDAVRVTGKWQPDPAPTKKQIEYVDVPVEEHGGEVVWTAPIEFATGTDPTTVTINGHLDGQMCEEMGSCRLLASMNTKFAAAYAGDIPAAKNAGATRSPDLPGSSISSHRDGAVRANESAGGSGVAGDPEKTFAGALTSGLLAKNIVFGLLGGLILNLMPCVLPVIGLKVLTFVEQGGDNRLRVWNLNLAYSAGLIFVFLVLATMATFFQFAWGQQFTLPWFKVSMIVLVFAMALSFLGIWEIPIPGFVGSGKSGELAAKEGYAGAFFKGVFTTLLATPCGGPFLGPVFAYTLRQPATVIYAIFASVGIGMSLPYLLIGAFPNLIKFLPKPGAWMDTFKQLMGFLLLATIVYLFLALSSNLFIPTLALMMGVWFACWWIGRTPLTANLDRKLAAWLGGCAVATAVGVFAFTYLQTPVVEGHSAHVSKANIPWKSFSIASLQEATAAGQTVMVEFTANWCPNCKYNMATAIDTAAVSQVLAENDVVPMIADWTNESPEIEQMLKTLGSASIPLLAIFPAGNPDAVIVLPDILTQPQVVEALRQAGPSQSGTSARTASAGDTMSLPGS